MHKKAQKTFLSICFRVIKLVPDTFLAIADILRAGRPDILIPYQQLQDIKLLETLAGLVGVL